MRYILFTVCLLFITGCESNSFAAWERWFWGIPDRPVSYTSPYLQPENFGPQPRNRLAITAKKWMPTTATKPRSRGLIWDDDIQGQLDEILFQQRMQQFDQETQFLDNLMLLELQRMQQEQMLREFQYNLTGGYDPLTGFWQPMW